VARIWLCVWRHTGRDFVVQKWSGDCIVPFWHGHGHRFHCRCWNICGMRFASYECRFRGLHDRQFLRRSTRLRFWQSGWKCRNWQQLTISLLQQFWLVCSVGRLLIFMFSDLIARILILYAQSDSWSEILVMLHVLNQNDISLLGVNG